MQEKKIIHGFSFGKAWPVLFWGWVLFVSVWIESAQIHEPQPSTSTHQYSGITFSDISFEQRDLDQTFIHLLARKGIFDSENATLHIEEPAMNGNMDGKPFSAKGNRGIINFARQASSLPSEIDLMELQGQTIMEGKDNRDEKITVKSDSMIFDNTNSRFLFPGACQIDSAIGSSNMENMYYDPKKGTLASINTLKSK
jgi:hypothetical protein